MVFFFVEFFEILLCDKINENLRKISLKIEDYQIVQEILDTGSANPGK